MSSVLREECYYGLKGSWPTFFSKGKQSRHACPRLAQRKLHYHQQQPLSEKMHQGRTKEGLEHLKRKEREGILGLDDHVPSGPGVTKQVRDILMEKHPPGQPTLPNSLLRNVVPPAHPIIFNSIDSNLIRTAALRTSGSAGPSGLDAPAWRELCTCFNSASTDLCQSLTGTAKCLCIEFVDPSILSPFLA